MKVVETIAEMKELRGELQEPVGFVPTMGYLHEGHLSLIKKAKEDNQSAVVSIFVNPTQFGPKEDLVSYPRDIPRDLAMLESVGTDAVFIPSAGEMYPEGFSTWVVVEGLTDRLEGAARPGHFRGVTTVVVKLFGIVQPTRAYFGQKDAQQAFVLTKMATDLNMPLDVITLPTVRESDGLAMSSRNTYLTPEERKAAPVVYRSLLLAQKFWSQGEKDTGRIKQAMKELIEKEPLAGIEYISITDARSLQELEKVNPPALVSMVVKFGKTRLLDNIVLK